MFRITAVLLYNKSCPEILFSLRSATLQKMLPQAIVNSKTFSLEDHQGYNSLARTLAFKHPCAAIAYNDSSRKLYISFNNHSEDFQRLAQAQKFIRPSVENAVKDHMFYLNKPSEDVDALRNLIGLVISKSHSYPLFSLRPVPNKLKQLDGNLEDTKRFPVILQNIKSGIKNFVTQEKEALNNEDFFELYSDLIFSTINSRGLTVHYLMEALQPLLDIIKIRKLYSSEPISYEILQNISGHHAELAVLKYCKDNKINLESTGMGISKLTCFICHTILEHHGIKDVGTHGLLYLEYHNKILEDFLVDDKLCLKVRNILNEYVSKQRNLDGIAQDYEGLRGVEKKLLPQAIQDYRSESYLLDFTADMKDIDVTLGILGLDGIQDLMSHHSNS